MLIRQVFTIEYKYNCQGTKLKAETNSAVPQLIVRVTSLNNHLF